MIRLKRLDTEKLKKNVLKEKIDKKTILMR